MSFRPEIYTWKNLKGAILRWSMVSRANFQPEDIIWTSSPLILIQIKSG